MLTAKQAVILFLMVAVALVIALVWGRLDQRLVGAIFALALVTFGLLSGGFRRKSR